MKEMWSEANWRRRESDGSSALQVEQQRVRRSLSGERLRTLSNGPLPLS